MKRISFRELSGEEIKRIRQQVVRLKEMGKTGKEIEQLTGVGQSRVSEIWKAYQCNGEASLEVKKRGVQRILFPEEEAETREIIINRPPKEFGLPGDQWTMSNVRKYVWNTYKKSLTDRCALNYLHRWGLSCQQPVEFTMKQIDGERPDKIEKNTIFSTEVIMADRIKQETKESPSRKKWTDKQKKAVAAARAERKEKAESMKPELVVQYGGADIKVDTLLDAAIADFRNIKKRTPITSLNLYIKPEENAAYYVINEQYEGKIIF